MQNINSHVTPLLTDLYEVTMAYAYFQAGRHEDHAVFDLFFRKNPFGGEFTVCAGISEALAFIENYRWTSEDIEYVAKQIPQCTDAFKRWLAGLDCSQVTVHAIKEGDVMFPRIPVIRVQGPLAICQLLESTLLNLIGFPSLVATYASRLRLAAGDDKSVIEFGLRRAQGPDGALSAARYSYLGGLDGTSNVMAGKLFDMSISGTQAHAYISSFTGLEEISDRTMTDTNGDTHNFVELVLNYRKKLNYIHTHDGELASFIAYAQAFPNGFLALVDTYDTLRSGVPNAVCVALALASLGHQPLGIRLDSGDLSHLSKESRRIFNESAEVAEVDLPEQKIVASNEIDEDTLGSLNQQGHEVDIFGIGTRLVTCADDPSLGVVYKIVQVRDEPRIKLSEDTSKVTIPGKKLAYRLYSSEGFPLVDLMIGDDEKPPEPGKKVLCCHPYERARRTYVTPIEVEPVHHVIWDGKLVGPIATLNEAREYRKKQLGRLREDHLRRLNPTPYKVSLSEQLFDFMHELWQRSAAPRELF